MLYSTSQPSRCCPSRHFRAPPRRIQRLPLALRRTQRRRCQVVQIPLPVIRVCGSEPALPRLPGAAAARPARRSAPAASQSESSPRLGRCGAPSPSFRGARNPSYGPGALGPRGQWPGLIRTPSAPTKAGPITAPPSSGKPGPCVPFGSQAQSALLPEGAARDLRLCQCTLLAAVTVGLGPD